MPALLDSAGGATFLGDDQPVQIGDVVMDFGPRSVQSVKTPRVAVQQGQNSVFRWDYGWAPVAYVVEGYAASNTNALGYDVQADILLARQVIDQFPDGVTAMKFLVPSMGVQDMVVLVSAQLSEDATLAPNEPLYRLNLAAANVPGGR